MTETRRRFIGLGMGGAANLLLAGGGRLCASALGDERAGMDSNPISELIKVEVRLARWIRGHQEQILKAPLDQNRARHVWVDYGFRWPALAKNDLGERTNASIAISQGDIFIRTWQHLWCIGKAPE